MSHYVADESGEHLAEISGSQATCVHPIPTRIGFRPCHVHIQRMPGGDLADGVRAHYKTVHPEKRL